MRNEDDIWPLIEWRLERGLTSWHQDSKQFQPGPVVPHQTFIVPGIPSHHSSLRPTFQNSTQYFSYLQTPLQSDTGLRAAGPGGLKVRMRTPNPQNKHLWRESQTPCLLSPASLPWRWLRQVQCLTSLCMIAEERTAVLQGCRVSTNILSLLTAQYQTLRSK